MKYVGGELFLARTAFHWKRYFHYYLAPYVIGDVLEVGAGVGGTTVVLCNDTQKSWLALEPDPDLASEIVKLTKQSALPAYCRVSIGSIMDIEASSTFDTILYIDVLEHIEDDRRELERAGSHLRPGGHLVVLAPAFPFLFSQLDSGLAHYRRYTRRTLSQRMPTSLRQIDSLYLDSVGGIISLLNKSLLKQNLPSPSQYKFWDYYIISLSRVVDRLIFHSFGRSLISVWEKRNHGDGNPISAWTQKK